jgi:hypothetical protein
MSVQKRKRELLKVARAICPDAEVDTTRGTHIMVLLKGPLGTRKVFCAMTPSDHRDAKNVKRDLMQAARAVGVIAERSPAASHNDN